MQASFSNVPSFPLPFLRERGETSNPLGVMTQRRAFEAVAADVAAAAEGGIHAVARLVAVGVAAVGDGLEVDEILAGLAGAGADHADIVGELAGADSGDALGAGVGRRDAVA